MSAFGNRINRAWITGPIGIRDFRYYVVGQFTSTVGDYCYAVALPWFILSSHRTTALLGIVLACYGIPRAVAMPIGGILADRMGPRLLMLVADIVRCGLMVMLAAMASTHYFSVWALELVAAVLGAGEGIFLPASFTIIPELLPPENLQSGNAISSMTLQIGAFVGPVLGGLLVATSGIAPTFAVDAVSFAVSALTLGALRLRTGQGHPGPAGSPHHQADDQITDGPGVPGGVFQIVRQAKFLQVILLICAVAGIVFGGLMQVALPALAHASFGARGYGILLSGIALGAAIGTVLSARVASAGRPAALACAAYLVESVAAGLTPFAGGLVGATAAMTILGLCNGLGNVVMITLLQHWSPRQFLGRIMSLVMLTSFGAFPASVALAGVFVRYFGPTLFFPAAGGLVAIAALYGVSQPEFRSFGAVTTKYKFQE